MRLGSRPPTISSVRRVTRGSASRAKIRPAAAGYTACDALRGGSGRGDHRPPGRCSLRISHRERADDGKSYRSSRIVPITRSPSARCRKRRCPVLAVLRLSSAFSRSISSVRSRPGSAPSPTARVSRAELPALPWDEHDAADRIQTARPGRPGELDCAHGDHDVPLLDGGCVARSDHSHPRLLA